jgi:hypothetical protein
VEEPPVRDGPGVGGEATHADLRIWRVKRVAHGPLLIMTSDLDRHIGGGLVPADEELGSPSGRAAAAVVAAVDEMLGDLDGGHAFSSA